MQHFFIRGLECWRAGKSIPVGRGTDAPFEQVGAAWIKGQPLADYLNNRQILGIRVYATRLRPAASNFSGEDIEGIRFVITDRDAFNSVRFGLEVGSAIGKLFPGRMNWQANEKLSGDERFQDA